MSHTPTIAIIGAGMSGLCMGAKLKQAGIETFTIYEKAGDVGGTWRDNSYPGLHCDAPSRYYSYSFELNPDWSRLFAPGPEIHAYFKRVTDRLDLRRHLRLSSEVTRAVFERNRWRITLASGEVRDADFLLSACGFLHHPRYPDLPGLDSFEGPKFHSARWDHGVEVRGRRVGLIGNGSSGTQLAIALSREAGHLTHFQRTPQWVFPFPNPHYSELSRRLVARYPKLNRFLYRRWRRTIEVLIGRPPVEPTGRWVIEGGCRLNLRSVRDPELRRRLTPPDSPMCKRQVFASGYYKALQRPNVSVVTDGIERAEPRGLVTRDGRLHELDVLVMATGFDSHAYLRPVELVGPDGTTLEDAWREGAYAYRTVALPGFPNFFMLVGPHSPVGTQSVVAIAEDQAHYIVEWIKLHMSGAYAAAAPRHDATERYNAELREALPGTVWAAGCNSWYLGRDGLPELWPFRPERHTEMLREPHLAEFVLEPAERLSPAAQPVP